MQAAVSGVLVTASRKPYAQGTKEFRELWIATGPGSAPASISVPDTPPAQDAFQELCSLEWLTEVDLIVEVEGFGREQTLSYTLVGIPVDK